MQLHLKVHLSILCLTFSFKSQCLVITESKIEYHFKKEILRSFIKHIRVNASSSLPKAD